MSEAMTTDLTGECARCGESHYDLEFQPLTRPTEWSHWAPCPTNGEPIMLKIVDLEEQADE